MGLPDSDRELDGFEDATFDIVTVAGINVPILTSGIIGGGIINDARDNPGDIGPADGIQIRTSNRTGTRDTETVVAASGGEWESNDWLIEFEANAAESKTATNSFITVFQLSLIHI